MEYAVIYLMNSQRVQNKRKRDENKKKEKQSFFSNTFIMLNNFIDEDVMVCYKILVMEMGKERERQNNIIDEKKVMEIPKKSPSNL